MFLPKVYRVRFVPEKSVEGIAADIEAELTQVEAKANFAETVEAMVAATLASKNFDVKIFAGLMQLTELSFEELFRHYVGKYVLNFFRQDHGYKTGEYVKIWNGREDNEVLMDVLKATDANSPDFKDKVYQGLKQAYPA